jgi:hypothetical protein
MTNNTPLLNKGEFNRGQKDGVKGSITAMTSIIDGTDKGSSALRDRELEKIRRVFLMWREYLIENMKKDEKAKGILVETKKIMDIVIPDYLR